MFFRRSPKRFSFLLAVAADPAVGGKLCMCVGVKEKHKSKLRRFVARWQDRAAM